MPQPALTPEETRLAAFCRVCAVLYFAGALLFALFPEWTYHLASAGADFASFAAEAEFWNVLAVGMMTAAATACLVTAARPRERRHALLPVLVAKLSCSGLAAAHLLGAGGSPALLAVLIADAPLFVITLAVYRAAAPGVHSASAREGPPPAVEHPAKIQLKLSK